MRGDEVRACWEAADGGDAAPVALPRPMGAGSVWAAGVDADETSVRFAAFHDVATVAADGRDGRTEPSTSAFDPPRWSLFGETDA